MLWPPAWRLVRTSPSTDHTGLASWTRAFRPCGTKLGGRPVTGRVENGEVIFPVSLEDDAAAPYLLAPVMLTSGRVLLDNPPRFLAGKKSRKNPVLF
jgi:hypothetical protein